MYVHFSIIDLVNERLFIECEETCCPFRSVRPYQMSEDPDRYTEKIT